MVREEDDLHHPAYMLDVVVKLKKKKIFCYHDRRKVSDNKIELLKLNEFSVHQKNEKKKPDCGHFKEPRVHKTVRMKYIE